MLDTFGAKLSSCSLSDRELRFVAWWLSNRITSEDCIPSVSVLPFETDALALEFCDRIGEVLMELGVASTGYYFPYRLTEDNVMYFVLIVMCHESVMDDDSLRQFARQESDEFYCMLSETDVNKVVYNYYMLYNRRHHLV